MELICVANGQEVPAEARPLPVPSSSSCTWRSGRGRKGQKRRVVEGTRSWATGDGDNGRCGIHVWACSQSMCWGHTAGAHGQAIWSAWEVHLLWNIQSCQQAQPQSDKIASLINMWPNLNQSNEWHSKRGVFSYNPGEMTPIAKDCQNADSPHAESEKDKVWGPPDQITATVLSLVSFEIIKTDLLGIFVKIH